MKKISLDTNILINNPDIVNKKGKDFVVSFKVVQELDSLKRNPDLKTAAQLALKNLEAQIRVGNLEVLNMPTKLGDTPDEIIINDTKNANAVLMSDDLGARLIAQAFDVEISNFEVKSDLDPDFTGITYIQGTIDYESNMVQVKDLPLDEFNELFGTSLVENQYCIVKRIATKNDIWWNHEGVVTRISQSSKPLKDAGVKDTPIDDEQMCALHSISTNEIPLTIIDGEVGTGKTLLSLMGALICTTGQKRFKYYDKIIVTKPPISIDRSLYTGFKPGSSEEKMSGHLGGIKSNLKFLLEKDEKDKKAELATTVWDESFDIIEIDEIQGTSLHDTILLVDEYQLLSDETLKLVLTRIASGSKVILIGDTRGQTYGVNRANEGFKRLYTFLGKSPLMSYIRLTNIYRSALAEFISEVYDD